VTCFILGFAAGVTLMVTLAVALAWKIYQSFK